MSAHHELLTELASLSSAAQPTAFHSFLNSLDQEGRLLRCYTQNIDGLEARAGLSVGIPAQQALQRRSKGKGETVQIDAPLSELDIHFDTPSAQSPLPRCIPLHGQLTTLHCPLCSSIFPLTPFLPLSQASIPCPTCNLSATIRHALSERQRRSGSLRANVVLYGEEHMQGEAIGSLVERDLRGRDGKVDFLLVAGTSLAIPGVKRIVKEMARVLHAGPGRSVKVVYVNHSPAEKMAEWDGVFDVWVKCNVQQIVVDHLSTPSPSTPIKPKRPREGLPTPESTAKRRKVKYMDDENSSDFTTPAKAARGAYLPTPRVTPPSPRTAHVLSRSGFEGSLTPLSDGLEKEEENPFLDPASGIAGHSRI